jgi:hypothetical protein
LDLKILIKKYLFSIEMNHFGLIVEDNLKSEKTVKIRIWLYNNLFVPVISDKHLFYVTQLKDKNDRKNKKSKIIIHLDWNYDSTIVVDKMKFRLLKNSTDYTEIIDLSKYDDIETITLTICYSVGKSSLHGFPKHDYMPFRLNRYSVTIFFDKGKDYYPLLIKSM